MQCIEAAKVAEVVAKDGANELPYKASEWLQMEFQNRDLSREVAGRQIQIKQLEANKEMWKEQRGKERKVGY